MPTQRIAIATVAGEAAAVIEEYFARWRNSTAAERAVEIDRFCDALRINAASPPVVCFCEWIDSWSMGDRILHRSRVGGTRFQASCVTRLEAIAWAESCGDQHQEESWLAARLREASSAWCGPSDRISIVVVREVLGPLISDEEVAASLEAVPAWLSDI
jgi:hypothetical protein